MSTYESELAAWKAKHGLDPKEDQNQDEIAMHAEEVESSETAWCVYCDAELPVSQMKLITRRIDPYVQIHEGESDFIPKSMRVRSCQNCFQERYGENS